MTRPSDLSKGTTYNTHCLECKHDIVIKIDSQRLPKPAFCPFCGENVAFRVDSIITRPH